MAYSTATSLAVAILLFIHFKSEECLYEYLATKAISEELDIPVPTTVKILSKLNTAGLIHAKEGAKGGILLAKSITKITFLEVFDAVEQGKPLFKIKYDFDMDYEKLDSIKKKGIQCFKEAEDAMKKTLKKRTLSDLLK